MWKKNKKFKKLNMITTKKKKKKKNLGVEFENEKWIFFILLFVCLIYFFWDPSRKENKWLMK